MCLPQRNNAHLRGCMCLLALNTAVYTSCTNHITWYTSFVQLSCHLKFKYSIQKSLFHTHEISFLNIYLGRCLSEHVSCSHCSDHMEKYTIVKILTASPGLQRPGQHAFSQHMQEPPWAEPQRPGTSEMPLLLG